MSGNVVQGKFKGTEVVSDFDAEVEALMKRHGATAFAVMAECGKELVAMASFHGATREDDQRAQFMLSAVCAHKSAEFRDLALGLYEDDDA